MEEFLNKYKINPYDFLGIPENCNDTDTIKQAYKAKAKVLHPDKTNGRTEVEFKILMKCYLYATKQVKQPEKQFHELKQSHEYRGDQSRDEETNRNVDLDINNIHDINRHFEDTDHRRHLFHQDDLDFKLFEDKINAASKRSTSYSTLDTYTNSLYNQVTENGKMNREKFNAYFLEMKKRKPGTGLIKHNEIKAYNDDSLASFTSIHTNGEISLYSDSHKGEGNFRNLLRQNDITQQEIDELLKIDQKKIKALIRENKKDTGKISRKKFKELLQQKSAPVPVPPPEKRSFAEASQEMENKLMEDIRREREEQSRYVQTHQIYRRRIGN